MVLRNAFGNGHRILMRDSACFAEIEMNILRDYDHNYFVSSRHHGCRN